MIYIDTCLFCKIVTSEIPCSKVYEDEKVLCFNDINKEAPFHVLVIPKKHIESVNTLKADELEIISHIFSVIQKVTKDNGISENGYRVITNIGEDAGQTVKHLHFHVLGGRNLKWPPG